LISTIFGQISNCSQPANNEITSSAPEILNTQKDPFIQTTLDFGVMNVKSEASKFRDRLEQQDKTRLKTLPNGCQTDVMFIFGSPSSEKTEGSLPIGP
jgi:hypothetical protein